MKTRLVEVRLGYWQYEMYQPVQRQADKYPTLAAIAGIPLAFAEITLETLKPPLQVIEGLALVIINLLGMFFNEAYSFKDCLLNLDKTFTFAIRTPIALVLAPFKFIYQATSNFQYPGHMECYDHAIIFMKDKNPILHHSDLTMHEMFA